MQVEFRTKKLKECYLRSETATRQWGAKVGRRYIERVNILKAAKSVGDLYKTVVLHFHPLTGDKKGLYALTLIDRWRLIVSFREKEMTIVKVEEVSAHYGD